MSEAPRFSSLIISRPRRGLVRIAPLAALLLALGVHLLTALGLFVSHFLFIEALQPARLRADGNDLLPEGNCLSNCGDDAGGGGSGPWSGVPDGVYREGDPRLSLPRLIEASRILPAYPDIARRAHLQGSVLLRIIVRADGSVGAIEVVRSPDPRLGFDLAAIEAVKQWRYDPARLGPLPVAVQMSVMVEFVISR